VFRGEERLGITPLDISDWLVGEYTLRLEQETYTPSQVHVKIEEGETHPVEVTLLSVDLVQYREQQRTTAFTRAGLWTGATVLVGAAAVVLYASARNSASNADRAAQQYLTTADPSQIAQQRDAIASEKSTAIRERNVAVGLAALATVGVAWVIYEFMSVPSLAPAQRGGQ